MHYWLYSDLNETTDVLFSFQTLLLKKFSYYFSFFPQTRNNKV